VEREVKDRASRSGETASELLDNNSNTVLSNALREMFAWLRRAAPDLAVMRISQQQFALADLAEFQNTTPPCLRTALLLNGCGTAFLALLCEGEGGDDRTLLERRVGELLSRMNGNQGSAVLLHAPAWLRARCNVWGPPRPDFPLMQRVKLAFDPQNIFSPGRFAGGI
jgi:FAD/FMN-containing dehydrogenase